MYFSLFIPIFFHQWELVWGFWNEELWYTGNAHVLCLQLSRSIAWAMALLCVHALITNEPGSIRRFSDWKRLAVSSLKNTWISIIYLHKLLDPGIFYTESLLLNQVIIIVFYTLMKWYYKLSKTKSWFLFSPELCCTRLDLAVDRRPTAPWTPLSHVNCQCVYTSMGKLAIIVMISSSILRYPSYSRQFIFVCELVLISLKLWTSK